MYTDRKGTGREGTEKRKSAFHQAGRGSRGQNFDRGKGIFRPSPEMGPENGGKVAKGKKPGLVRCAPIVGSYPPLKKGRQT